MFQYESGEIAVLDGESLIHTDGTGLISVDLARECPTSIFKGNFLKDAVDSKGYQYLTSEHVFPGLYDIIVCSIISQMLFGLSNQPVLLFVF